MNVKLSVVFRAIAVCAVGTLICGMSPGCSGVPRPQTRFGSLPFPGAASLFAAADSNRVVPHYYRPRYARLLQEEGDRGIVYTEKAGFVDLTHAREAMDWTRYIHERIKLARQDRISSVAFSYDNAEITFDVPSASSDQEDIALSGAMAYRILVWHEVATWWGYSMVPFVSEARSSFTPDDLTAHAIGVRAASQVLTEAQTVEQYEQLAGIALQEEISELHPLAPAEAVKMCLQLRGLWWEGSTTNVVDAQLGLAAGEKVPLVADERGRPVRGVPLVWNPSGMSPNYVLAIRGSVGSKVRRVVGSKRLQGDRDLGRVVNAVVTEISQRRSIVWTDAPGMSESRSMALQDGRAHP